MVLQAQVGYFWTGLELFFFFKYYLLFLGKTLLARAVAHHTECTFIRVSGSELVQKFIGEGSRMVRELFVMARYVSRRKLSIFLVLND